MTMPRRNAISREPWSGIRTWRRLRRCVTPAQAVLNLDPFNRRLGNLERARRATLAFDSAISRLQSCASQKGIDLKAAGSDPLQALYAETTDLQPRAKERYLSSDSALLSQVMDTGIRDRVWHRARLR